MTDHKYIVRKYSDLDPKNRVVTIYNYYIMINGYLQYRFCSETMMVSFGDSTLPEIYLTTLNDTIRNIMRL